MLVLSRTRNESIIVTDSGGSCVVTLLQVRGDDASFLVSHSLIEKPGELDTWTTALVRGDSLKVGQTAKITLVDIREEKARIGIDASKSASVHRLEVWESIHPRQRQSPGDDAGDGCSGSPVSPSSGPKPPSLEVRLEEPREGDAGGK